MYIYACVRAREREEERHRERGERRVQLSLRDKQAVVILFHDSYISNDMNEIIIPTFGVSCDYSSVSRKLRSGLIAKGIIYV